MADEISYAQRCLRAASGRRCRYRQVHTSARLKEIDQYHTQEKAHKRTAYEPEHRFAPYSTYCFYITLLSYAHYKRCEHQRSHDHFYQSQEYICQYRKWLQNTILRCYSFTGKRLVQEEAQHYPGYHRQDNIQSKPVAFFGWR